MTTDTPRDSTSSPRVTKNSLVRATGRNSLSIVFVAAILAGLFGLNPPWPVTILFIVGTITVVWLVIAKRPMLGMVAVIVTILISAWPLRTAIEVRAAGSDDPISNRYFGIDTSDKNNDVKIRNIAVVTGTFTLNTWLSASLYHVKSGEIQEINSFTVGRTPNAIGAPHWVDMKITLALGDRIVPEGRITELGSAGQSRGGGSNSEIINNVDPIQAMILPGRITSGTKRILYIEGDPGITVDQTTTVEHFAEENKGDYLVVEIELH